jgi:8-amino-7-oxononanoate synthase
MNQDREAAGDRLRTLDGYVQKRLQLAGGSLLTEEHLERNPLDMLKTVYLRPLDALRAEHESAGKPFVSFANYDYVGLAQDRRVKRAACSAIMETGLGAGASRLVGGERTVHNLLERELAAFLGVDDVVALVSGYLTNVSLVGHLLTKTDLIIVDELSHNSLIVGTDISRARIIRFIHNDLDHLESILQKHRNEANRVLIIVEGLYSMDGDIVNLPRLLELRDRYGVWVMIDEAHSLGVMGAKGRGVAEHFGIDARKIDLIVGTLSKSLGACGGFVAGRRTVIEWLRFTLPAFVFSVGISPAIAAAVRQTLAILQAEPARVKNLQENSQLFLAEAKKRGLNTGAAIGAGVVPVLFSTPHECMMAARELLEAGYYAPPILQLAVPKDKPRIRFFISTAHTHSQVRGVVSTLGTITESMVSRSSWLSRRRHSRAGVNVAMPVGPVPMMM